MLVEAIMTTDLVTIRPDENLKTALERMHNTPCRHLPVINEDAQLLGIISDRDCLLALNSPHLLRERWQDVHATEATYVQAMMTPDPQTIRRDTPVRDAAALLLQRGINALPVIAANGQLVGIVTSSDLLRVLVEVIPAQR